MYQIHTNRYVSLYYSKHWIVRCLFSISDQPVTFLKGFKYLNFMGNSWSKHEEKQHDFQQHDVFSSTSKRNTVDSLLIPAINGSYVTVIPKDRNYLLNLLPQVSRLQCRKRVFKHSLAISLRWEHRVCRG